MFALPSESASRSWVTSDLQPAPSESEQYRQLAEAIARLQRESKAPVVSLENRLAAIRGSRGTPCRTDAACIRLWQAVTDQAAKSGVNSHLTVSTSNGSGAAVRYETLGARLVGSAPRIMSTPSESTDDVAIGTYYVWAERNGLATSSKDSQFDIVTPQRTITLIEH